jgi:hypothetical protein
VYIRDAAHALALAHTLPEISGNKELNWLQLPSTCSESEPKMNTVMISAGPFTMSH